MYHYELFLELFYTSVITPFENEWDVLSKGRFKAVHSVGGVCKFTLDITNSSYTGLLKNGTRKGIMRLGSSRDVADNAGVRPGIGVKFMRTGRSSGNFFLMHKLDPIRKDGALNYNFFSVPVFTHIKPSLPSELPSEFKLKERKAGVMKFEQASQCSTRLGLSELARSVHITYQLMIICMC